MNLPNKILLCFILGFAIAQNIFAESIQVISEKTPFTSNEESTVGGGEATAFVRKLLDTTNLEYEFSYQPWKRAYNFALREKNILIYPLARSQTREDLFVWVGELIPVNYYLVKLKSRDDIKVEVLADAKKYRIGLVNFHVTHEYLTRNNFHDLQPVNSNLQNLRKAQLDRIDLFPISDGGLLQLCKRHKLDCDQFEPVFKLTAISNGLYLAFSKNTNQVILDQLDRGFKQMIASGAHREIFEERLADIERYDQIWSK